MGPLALALFICLAAVMAIFGLERALAQRRRASRSAMPATPPTPLMQDSCIGSWTARSLQAGFLVLIALPAMFQFITRPGEERQELWQFVRAPNSEARARLETELSRSSEWSRDTRRAYQALATYTLRQGSPKVIIGHDHELFYREDVRFALNPGFLSPAFQRLRPPAQRNEDALQKLRSLLLSTRAEPRPKPARPAGDDIVGCIVDFRDQLQARGIHLVLLPVPCKTTIYPEELWPGYPVQAGPALNADYDVFLRRLDEAKVDVLDLTAAMWNAKATASPSLWLRYDTHWAPAGVTVAANDLAARVQPWLPDAPRHPFRAVPSKWVEDSDGDLMHMLLEKRGDARFFPPVEHSLVRVYDGARPATADDDAPVLLLGDSMAWFYSGVEAGLAHQMMLRFRVPVQEIDIFAVASEQGVSDPRHILAERPQALAKKKVVIWEFASRVLADPERRWEKIPLSRATDDLPARGQP